LKAAKKQLKKLHNLNKKNSGQSFIASATSVTKCPNKKKKDEDEGEASIGKMAAKALLNKKNPEKVQKLARKAIRKIAENEDF